MYQTGCGPTNSSIRTTCTQCVGKKIIIMDPVVVATGRHHGSIKRSSAVCSGVVLLKDENFMNIPLHYYFSPTPATASIHPSIHTYIYTYIHTYIHTYIRQQYSRYLIMMYIFHGY